LPSILGEGFQWLTLSNCFRTFESNLTLLLLDVFPSITAPKGHGARNRLQGALTEYYGRKADKDGSGIVQCRANIVRKYGIRDDRVGIIELALLHVATSNTIPTLFWLVAHIVTRPDVVERLREEVIAVVKHTAEGEVTVDVSDLADNCPLLVSSYRETIRLNNVAIGNRRVMKDTTVSDGKGNTYLLKEGINLQMPSEPLHLLEDVWGPDAADFSADRFLDQAKGLNNESVKAKRTSYNPFGGGRHLCPGRHFAFAENLGFMVQFLLSFDIEPLDGNWDTFKAPEKAVPYLIEAVCKPKKHGEGFGARIKKREGWQNTKWKWTSAGH
jgi:cytochrome P450